MIKFVLCPIAILFLLSLGLNSYQAQTSPNNTVPPPKKMSPGIFGIEFSRDGRTLVSANFNGTVKLWDVASGRLLRTLDGHSDVVYKGVFSPDEKLLASCSRDGKIGIWDVATGRELRTLSGHTRPVKAVAFSPDGNLLASASNDGTLRLWDVSSGSQRRSFVHTKSGEVDNSVYSLVFISRGKIIAAGNGDGTVSYWEVASGEEVKVLHGHSGGVFSLTLSADGRLLASGSYDHTVKFWDVEMGNEIRTFADQRMQGVTEQVRGISLSPDGKLLASSEVGFTQSGNDFQYVYRRIKVWDLKTGKQVLIINEPRFEISGIAFSPNSRFLAGAGPEGVIKLWDVKTGRQERSIPAPTIRRD
jgi:WD40 repeat protein